MRQNLSCHIILNAFFPFHQFGVLGFLIIDDVTLAVTLNLGIGAGDAFVRIYPDELPIIPALDVIRVVVNAELKKVRDELRDVAVHTANYEELRDLAERDPRKEKEHGRD